MARYAEGRRVDAITRMAKLGAATLAALFCIAATAGPAAAERFGSCEIHDSGSKSGKAKKQGKKDRAKHKGGEHR